MDRGNWAPVSKAYVRYLPKNRPFTKLEAGFSIQVNYDNRSWVTLLGMSNLFGWSRNKARAFLKEIGVEICYAEETQKKQNQKGQIKGLIEDRSEEKKGQIRFIDSRQIRDKKDRSEGKKGQIKDRSKDAYNDPIEITNLNPKDMSKVKPEKSKREFTDEVKNLYLLFCKSYSESLGDFFKEPDSKQKTNWMNTLRLMIERDKHPVPQIKIMIQFAAEQYKYFLDGQQYAFQVLSVSSLREKYQKMLGVVIKKSNQKTNSQMKSPSSTLSLYERQMQKTQQNEVILQEVNYGTIPN